MWRWAVLRRGEMPVCRLTSYRERCYANVAIAPSPCLLLVVSFSLSPLFVLCPCLEPHYLLW